MTRRGPVMCFQSGGCCDGSFAMCFDDGEFIIGDYDVFLGEVCGAPFSIDARQYEVWKHTQLVLDVGEGEPEGFSLAAGEGRYLITRSRLCVCSPAESNDRRQLEPRESG